MPPNASAGAKVVNHILTEPNSLTHAAASPLLLPINSRPLATPPHPGTALSGGAQFATEAAASPLLSSQLLTITSHPLLSFNSQPLVPLCIREPFFSGGAQLFTQAAAVPNTFLPTSHDRLPRLLHTQAPTSGITSWQSAALPGCSRRASCRCRGLRRPLLRESCRGALRSCWSKPPTQPSPSSVLPGLSTQAVGCSTTLPEAVPQLTGSLGPAAGWRRSRLTCCT